VSDGKGWSLAHHAWLRRQTFGQPAAQIAFDAAYEAALLAESRRDRLDKAIVDMAAGPRWAPVVSRLQCLRGISTQTGTGLAVEIGDWHRFTGATVGAYLRLVPQRILQLRQPQPGTDHQDRRRARLPDSGRGHRAPPPGLPPSERVDVRLVGDGLASGPARGHAGNHVASPAIRIPMPRR
jgi:transposase